MIIKKYVQVKSVQIEDVLCNKCGKSTNTGMNLDYMDCHNVWGYGSKKDQTAESAEICESCWDEFAKTFAIPSQTGEDVIYE